MNAGMIFVLFLGAGFVAFVIYLARLSRRAERNDAQRDLSTNEVSRKQSPEKPPLKRAG